MRKLKNKEHSKLHKEYIEVKRRLTSDFYMLEFYRHLTWDEYEFPEKRDYETYRFSMISETKFHIKERIKLCINLKKQIYISQYNYTKNH